MTIIISGKEVADHLNEALTGRVQVLKEKGYEPCLCVVRVGDRPEDVAYERGALARCRKVGIVCRTKRLSREVSQEEILDVIRGLNEDEQVHGVLLLRPLPKGIDETMVVNSLIPEKDVDGMTDLSMGSLLSGSGRGFAPCTAEAAMACLDYYGIDCRSKKAVVVGRSAVFGKPAALLLTGRNATVTLCHTKTRDLPSTAKQAEILLVAAGRPGLITKECVSEGQIIIDVGINMGPDHRLCGDVAYDEVKETAAAITPVPGGVGAVTTSVLAAHVIEACERTMTSASV